MENEFVNKKYSSFVILIFLILKFQNLGRCTFDHSIFCIPPKNFELQKFQKSLIWKMKKI